MKHIDKVAHKVVQPKKTVKAKHATVRTKSLGDDLRSTRVIPRILGAAAQLEASDIHIEPREDHVQIRYRVGGVLRVAESLPKKIQAALISHIKIMAKLKVNEHHSFQEGSFTTTLAEKPYALQVSVMPIEEGEKIVIGLTAEAISAPSLSSLGFWGEALKTINNALTEISGLILVTGANDAGKSTTLLTLLSSLDSTSANISTVEEQIKFKIIGANQTAINTRAGMTAAESVKALLRQDPNVIMVESMQDSATADVIVQTALSGHLVFSTLHVSQAAAAFGRLAAMEVEPYLIASTVRLVINQNLVRKLCEDCRIQYVPDSDEVSELSKLFSLSTAADYKQLHQLEIAARHSGVGTPELPLASDGKRILRLWKANETGCKACGQLGHRGRLAVQEVLQNSPLLQRPIMSGARAKKIEPLAIAEGMIPIKLDGLIKAMCGLTTVAEVLRATR